MNNPLVIKEHSHTVLDDSIDIEGLKFFLKKNGFGSIFRFDGRKIKTTSYVGIVKYKKHQIQILPKLTGATDKELDGATSENKDFGDETKTILQNLVYMLNYSRRLTIKTNPASLSECENPFLEVLIREFCTSLFEALKRLTPKNYIREEDNLNFLRGKLKFTENIRYNAANAAKFYCEFDEFSENNVLNRLFLYVSTCLLKVSKDNKNRTILRRIADYFGTIDLIPFTKYNLSRIKLTRNQQIFEKPFRLAKMFIENSSVDFSSNRIENIALVWDMNKLFEEFIFEVLTRNEDENFKVKFQQVEHLLEAVPHGENKKQAKPDILVNDGIILDTKYKEFKDTSDVSNSDIHQVVTYCFVYGGAKKAFLIYPKHEETKMNENRYKLNTRDGEQVFINFIAVDIRRKIETDNDIRTLAEELKHEILRENNG